MEILQHSEQRNDLSVEEATTQVAMWQSLMKIFQLKLKITEGRNKNEIH